MDTVFITLISHEHGIDTDVYTTEELAVAAAVEFCQESWADLPSNAPLAPEDPEEIMETYMEWSIMDTVEVRGSTVEHEIKLQNERNN